MQTLFCAGSKSWHRVASAATLPAPSPPSGVVSVAIGPSPAVKVAITLAGPFIVKPHVLNAQPAAAPLPPDSRPGHIPIGVFAAMRIAAPDGTSKVHWFTAGVVQRPPPGPMIATVPSAAPPTFTVSVKVCAAAGAASRDTANRTAGILSNYWIVTRTAAKLLNAPAAVLCAWTTML